MSEQTIELSEGTKENSSGLSKVDKAKLAAYNVVTELAQKGENPFDSAFVVKTAEAGVIVSKKVVQKIKERYGRKAQISPIKSTA